ncbi:hypothetical protein RhiirA1_473104 [Rhizophagus irregularis]|uniref:Uncharacterized protein n=1 Tax=Rhizophagus irregularis TaxID=588596 RepID=A0A2I1DV06_9GLOM|nr:hypothetical protein RhiirA1_473104 [Rhizophagus irregularis]PKY13708.1 hypothetical protein RhiirB3_519038 [Rhizophagus irregularis]
MACHLPADCLDEIFEYLEEDKLTLHSCLLVNHLWCEISVRILWRNIWNFKRLSRKRSLRVSSSILSTLVACLPNESREILYKNEIFLSTPTSKPPLFNYASFCKVLSICRINIIVEDVLKNEPSSVNCLVTNEIIKMFMNQIYALKKLNYYCNQYTINLINFSFTYFPGAKDLSELYCSSNLPSNFFHQLSQICHNLQSISIDFHYDVSNGLKELIFLQNNLKDLTLSAFDYVSWENIIPAITKHSQTITKLRLYSDNELPFSFVGSFSNLQEFIFSFSDGSSFEDFKELQYVNFSKLQILKIPLQCPHPDYVKKFLEINGKNLKKFYTDENDKSLNLSIAKFCPNLTSLFIIFNKGEKDILKTIFNNCQHLESIKIWGGKEYLTEKEVFEIVVNHSPKCFCELKMYNSSVSDVFPKDLESFFINWKKRIPKKLLNLIIIKEFHFNMENINIIEKYENLGVVKFEIKGYEEEEDDEEEVYSFL